MSYPPPPDLKSSRPTSSSTTPQPHPSLPARPPPPASASFKPAFSAAPSSTSGAPGTAPVSQGRSSTPSNGYAAFKPRSVAGSGQEWHSNPSPYSSNYPTPPAGYLHDSYQQQPQPYAYPQQQQQHYQPYGSESYAQQAAPQIRNPFPLPGQGPHQSAGSNGRDRPNNNDYDPDMEAQIAQWQSAYVAKDETTVQKNSGPTGPQSAGGANAVALGPPRGRSSTTLTNQEVASAAKPDTGVASVVSGPDGKQKTVVRSGGGQTWQDPTLLEWDPAHFRLFVGNLAGEVTDESLLKAFSKYESVQKARVVRDKRTTKSKGYGFVSFSNGDQYFQAAKDMQGKYIGSHPVLLRRSTTEIRPTIPADKNKKGKGGKGGPTHGANTGAGVSKKQAKTKGGLKLLG